MKNKLIIGYPDEGQLQVFRNEHGFTVIRIVQPERYNKLTDDYDHEIWQDYVLNKQQVQMVIGKLNELNND